MRRKTGAELFADAKLWDEDLNACAGLADTVADYVYRILTEGIEKTIKSTL